MSITFSKEQLRAIYDLVINEDGAFIAEMAKCALSDGVDIAKDMWTDNLAQDIRGEDVPDRNDIIAQAVILIDNGFGSLPSSIEASVRSIEFLLSIRKTLTGGISFYDAS